MDAWLKMTSTERLSARVLGWPRAGDSQHASNQSGALPDNHGRGLRQGELSRHFPPRAMAKCRPIQTQRNGNVMHGVQLAHDAEKLVIRHVMVSIYLVA